MKYKELKMKMLENNRADFNKYLSEILNISEGSASRKLNGSVRFSVEEVKTLTEKFNIPIECF